MTPGQPNLAWVLRDKFDLSKKDLRLITGASHEEVNLWLAKRGTEIEGTYLVRLSQASIVLGALKDGGDKLIIGFLRSHHLWEDGTSSAGRVAIREGKADEVLEKAQIAVRERQKDRAKEKRAKKKRKHAKHHS